MNANILQDFRATQLAVVGAYFMCYNRMITDLLLEGIDRIILGDNIEISEISLNHDNVVVCIVDIQSIMPIKNLSNSIMTEIIATLKAKALDIANRDVLVNSKGKIKE